ncbi:hypothetical protein DID77_00010 [Candidatus Marinamargulisbacteria bacterium SCGC AG-439-L15]|nr:hypothetical protein DID77_00010 [Candidatus Marinamargulisbacteria bacterium SCGC AG-439-L15]
MEGPVKQLRQDNSEQLVYVVSMYIEAYEKFIPLFTSLSNKNGVGVDDKAIFQKGLDDLKLYLTDLQQLKCELTAFLTYSEEEQNAILEISGELLPKAVACLMSLPERLKSSKVADTLDLPDFSTH